MKAAIKQSLLRALPLGIRKRLALVVNRQEWLGVRSRGYYAAELLSDWARKDINEYHKFLWTHHLAYAETYDVERRFGAERLNATRRMMFDELPARLEAAGMGGCAEVKSVFEVGCSLGYLLRYMETDLFPHVARLEGIDIDTQAVRAGQERLKSLGSKAKLHCGDMEKLGIVLDGSRFDIVFACGVLLYLDEDSARSLVATMLVHTAKLLVITALAHPEFDNRQLPASVPRKRDRTWIHNVDAMVESAGGTVVARRWDGDRIVDGNSVYFLYCRPAHSVDR